MAGSMDKDLESLLCDTEKFRHCSVKTISFEPVGFLKANVKVIMTGDDVEVKSFMDIMVKEAKNKILTNTKATVKKDVSVEGPSVVGK